MLVLIAIPVITIVAVAHRYLQAYAPSNILACRVRLARPRWGIAAALIGTATVLLTMMHVVASAVAAGAPGWLNVAVLILAWDAIKIAALAAMTAAEVAVALGARGCRRLRTKSVTAKTGRSSRFPESVGASP